MLKFVLTAVFLGVLVCLLYQPISIPDDDSLINKYRPSLKLQSKLNSAEQSSENKLNIAVPNFQIDSINLKRSPILVDSTP
jgi:hypothetical protein